MHLTRRQAINLLLLAIASSTVQLSYSNLAASMAKKTEPLYGINAYYLMVESYRQVRQNPNISVKKTVAKYLQDNLGLAKLRDKSKVNAIRFWAFNNFPAPNSQIVNNKIDFDAVLWSTANQLDEQVLEILEIMMQSLAAMGFYLVPVLSNYWMYAGGILRYLEWAGRMTQQDWFTAYCHPSTKDEDLYLKYSIDFYTDPKVEKLFQNHVTPIINTWRNNSQVVIVDVMNEPRGKSHFSENNQVVKDGLYSHQIVAQWLNRQATFISNKLSPKISLSTGEEGWLASPVELPLKFLKTDSQYYEGIDLTANLSVKNSALTMGSIHMYPHEMAELSKANDCGNQYTDRRGWYYLLQQEQPQHSDSYLKMAEEWLQSRATAIGNKPWYVGEMGWCRGHPENRTPLSAAVLQPERIKIYRQWTEQALALGARGTFLWGLDGLQHRDEFYGLNISQIVEIFPKS